MTEIKPSEQIFTALKTALDSLAFATCLLPPNDYLSFYQLLVALDEEVQISAESADLILQLFFTHDTVVSEDPLQSSLTALQFVLTFPIEIEENELLTIHRFAAFFTEQMPMGHFSVDQNGYPYYRYVLLNSDPREILPEVVVEIVELIGMFANIFYQELQQWRLDELMSLEALILDTQAALRSLASQF